MKTIKSPPNAVPSEAPELNAIEFEDITEPLNNGTCSKVKLSEAVYLIEETIHPLNNKPIYAV